MNIHIYYLLRKRKVYLHKMNNYPNQEHPQETGPDYANGYQSQPYPQQPQQPIYPPQQYQPPGGYPPSQPLAPGYPPQQQPMAYPQAGYVPQQQMMMPQTPQPMMYPQPMMMAPQMNVNVNIGNQRPQQVSMLVRMIYFCLVGWWAGMFWLSIALSFCCSIIGLPIGLMMFNRLGAVMTLSRR